MPPCNFVTFKPPSNDPYSATPLPVTATVQKELPEFTEVETSLTGGGISGGSTEINITFPVVTTTTTKVVFVQIFLLWGSQATVNDNILTSGNDSCLALALFKEDSSSVSKGGGSKSVSTAQYATIPWYEWFERLPEVIINVMKSTKGEVYEYLPTESLASIKNRSGAVRLVEQRIMQLEKVKKVLSSK